MNFWQKRKIRKTLRKFREAAVSLRHADDDILSQDQKTALDQLIQDAREAEKNCDPAAEKQLTEHLTHIVPPRRFAKVREWLDIIAVALAVAFGIRGLFLQPFKIPTSSMQPTLYGIHYMEPEGSANPWAFKLPQPLSGILFSARNAEMTVKKTGQLNLESFRVGGNAIFDTLDFEIAGETYRLPGAPNKVAEYSGIVSDPDRVFQKGDVITRGKLSQGDHLFVDRWSINLAGLRRGDVTVFTTENIVAPDGTKLMDQSGFYYIKRLAGLPGDTLKIVNDQLFVKPAGTAEFKKIQELAPVFEKVYSGKGGYQGHTNSPGDAPCGYFLRTAAEEFLVPENEYFMLGDNTKYSSDSRIWGTVPRRNIVGKAFFVFWPLSRRWGLADTRGAYEVPTGNSVRGTFPSMYLQ